jgi:hypothetical protein
MPTLTLSLLSASAAALLAFGALAPAAAQAVASQTAAQEHANFALDQRETSLTDHLTASHGDGAMGANEFDRLTDVLAVIRTDEARMRGLGGGELTGSEALGLEARLDVAADDIHWWRHSDARPPW